MKRNLLCHGDGSVAKKQHRRACQDCPWARDAVQGWLGSLGADEWLQIAHGEGRAECHVHISAQCAGLAIYRANMAKIPRDPNALQLPADRERVFASPQQFRDHHEDLHKDDKP